MTRATWIGSAVAFLVMLVISAAWWVRNETNPALSFDDAAVELSEDSGVDPAPQDPLPEVETSQPQEEISQLPTRDVPIQRIGVDLSDVVWRPLFDYTDDSQYPPIYDELRWRAENGDANAAHFLWQSLQYCQRSGPPPMNEAEFAEELRLIREDHQVPQYDNGERRLVDIAELNWPTDAAVQLARLNYDQCKDMPMENRSEADQWKEFAVFNGSHAAASMVAWELAQEGDPSGLMDLWNDGDPMALNSLSGFFRQQFEARIDPAGLTKSFAYWLAFREMYYASRNAAGRDMKPFFGGIERTTTQLRNSLLPGQIVEAEGLAAEILRNRSANCCISLDVPK